jgi:hypothetical protein
MPKKEGRKIEGKKMTDGQSAVIPSSFDFASVFLPRLTRGSWCLTTTNGTNHTNKDCLCSCDSCNSWFAFVTFVVNPVFIFLPQIFLPSALLLHQTRTAGATTPALKTVIMRAIQ